MKRLAAMLVLALAPAGARALTVQYELETITRDFCSRTCIQYEDPVSTAHGPDDEHVFDLLGSITFEIDGENARLVAFDLEGGAEGYQAGRPRITTHLLQPSDVASGRADLRVTVDNAASDAILSFEPITALELLTAAHLELRALFDPAVVIPERCGLLFSGLPSRRDFSGTCADWAADPELASHFVTFPEQQIDGLDLQAVVAPEGSIPAMLVGALAALIWTRGITTRTRRVYLTRRTSPTIESIPSTLRRASSSSA